MSAPVLPPLFLERMSKELQDEFPFFLASYNESRINGLRVNPLKISVEDFRKRWPWELEPIPWTNDGFTYDYKTYPGQHPYHYAGVYYLQEPSAMAVLHYLDPQPGERILDLAAAPGGKSTGIASRLNHQGLLWANEIHPGRARILVQNLERWGITNGIVSNESPDRLAKHLRQFFDRVLLDAPCSGEGMFRKDPDAIQEWSPEHVLACANRQSLILESAAALVKPGGRLVYSTCTFSPEENEEVILRFLEQHPDFHPLPIPDPTPGFAHPPNLPEAVRLYPHRLRGEGHFIVALEKRQTQANAKVSKAHAQEHLVRSVSKKTSRSQKKGNPNNDFALFHEFIKSTFVSSTNPKNRFANLRSFANPRDLSANSEDLSSPSPLLRVLQKISSSSLEALEEISGLITFGDHLYLSPDPSISLAGLTILRPGLHLGEKKPGRFQPGQALAFALNPASVEHYLQLSPSDSRLTSYLRGESFPVDGPDGWVLVGVDEFPLGWAKRVKGELKNHYPKELRVKGNLLHAEFPTQEV